MVDKAALDINRKTSSNRLILVLSTLLAVSVLIGVIACSVVFCILRWKRARYSTNQMFTENTKCSDNSIYVNTASKYDNDLKYDTIDDNIMITMKTGCNDHAMTEKEEFKSLETDFPRLQEKVDVEEHVYEYI